MQLGCRRIEHGICKTNGQKDERTEGKGQRRLVERSYGRFERLFTLPSGINADKIEARYHNGVLELAIPKGQAARAKRVEIKEGAGTRSRLSGSKESGKESAK